MAKSENQAMMSIVVPVYCGELTIKKLFLEIKKHLDGVFLYEVIFVWDCGPDRSWDVICELKEAFPNYVKGIRLSRNFGQHNAIICGFGHASGDYIITMDEDLQHHPSDIKLLVETQMNGDYDVVYGMYSTREHAFWRNMTSSLMKGLLRQALPTLPTEFTSFRLIKRDIALATCEMRNSYTFLDGYLTWITASFGSCTVCHSERAGGRSGYTLRKLIEHSINIFITFSTMPVRLLTGAGITIFLSALLFSSYVVIRVLTKDDYQAGFPSLLIILVMGFSSMLMAIGVVGEYMCRINQKATRRPCFNERKGG